MKRALNILPASEDAQKAAEPGALSARPRALTRARMALARMPRRRIVQCEVRRVRPNGADRLVGAVLRRYRESSQDVTCLSRSVRLSVQA